VLDAIDRHVTCLFCKPFKVNVFLSISKMKLRQEEVKKLAKLTQLLRTGYGRDTNLGTLRLCLIKSV
jgi:hypothetical protein